MFCKPSVRLSERLKGGSWFPLAPWQASLAGAKGLLDINHKKYPEKFKSWMEIYMLHNGKLEIFSLKCDENGVLNIDKARATYCSHPIFGFDEERFERREYNRHIKELKAERGISDVKTPKKVDISDYRAIRADKLKRAKDKVYNIAVLNEFKYMVTFTVDCNNTVYKSGFNAKDSALTMRKVSKWLNHQVERIGLKYILIPEYQKNGSIHCHALVNDCFTFVDSGCVMYRNRPYKIETLIGMGVKESNIKRHKTVYNISEWKFGYSTAVKLDNQLERVSRYVTKYIVKGGEKIFGKYYWSSKNIKRKPDVMYFDVVDFDGIPGKKFKPFGSPYKFQYLSNISMSDEEFSTYSDEILKRFNAEKEEKRIRIVQSKSSNKNCNVSDIDSDYSQMFFDNVLKRQRELASVFPTSSLIEVSDTSIDDWLDEHDFLVDAFLEDSYAKPYLS